MLKKETNDYLSVNVIAGTLPTSRIGELVHGSENVLVFIERRY